MSLFVLKGYSECDDISRYFFSTKIIQKLEFQYNETLKTLNIL